MPLIRHEERIVEKRDEVLRWRVTSTQWPTRFVTKRQVESGIV